MTISADWALMKMIIRIYVGRVWKQVVDEFFMLVDAYARAGRIGVLHRELCYANNKIAY